MKRYFIEEVKCDLTNGGLSCGPVSGSVVVTVRFNEGSEPKWLSVVETEGIANYFLLNKDVHTELVEEDDETIDSVEEHYVYDINGIELDPEYSGTFESIADDPENPAVPFVRYIIALVRCDMDDVTALIEMATGRFVDELEIPISDLEEDFIEDNME